MDFGTNLSALSILKLENIPSQHGATGRSRLDFFLCNANLLDVIDRICYENTITDFDHKRVTLTSDCNRAPKSPKID